jgi:hypothetical protein
MTRARAAITEERLSEASVETSGFGTRSESNSRMRPLIHKRSTVTESVTELLLSPDIGDSADTSSIVLTRSSVLNRQALAIS